MKIYLKQTFQLPKANGLRSTQYAEWHASSPLKYDTKQEDLLGDQLEANVMAWLNYLNCRHKVLHLKQLQALQKPNEPCALNGWNLSEQTQLNRMKSKSMLSDALIKIHLVRLSH